MIDRIGLELVLARGKGSKSQSKVRRLTLCQNLSISESKLCGMF